MAGTLDIMALQIESWLIAGIMVMLLQQAWYLDLHNAHDLLNPVITETWNQVKTESPGTMHGTYTLILWHPYISKSWPSFSCYHDLLTSKRMASIVQYIGNQILLH